VIVPSSQTEAESRSSRAASSSSCPSPSTSDSSSSSENVDDICFNSQNFSSVAPNVSFLEKLVDHSVPNYCFLCMVADVVGDAEAQVADVVDEAQVFNSYSHVLRPLALSFFHTL
jgi:hypothetical protein